jgi:hypothetical protein
MTIKIGMKLGESKSTMKKGSKEKVINQTLVVPVKIKKWKRQLQNLLVKNMIKKNRVVKMKTGINLKARKK